jgi:hypothetical protein
MLKASGCFDLEKETKRCQLELSLGQASEDVMRSSSTIDGKVIM